MAWGISSSNPGERRPTAPAMPPMPAMPQPPGMGPQRGNLAMPQAGGVASGGGYWTKGAGGPVITVPRGQQPPKGAFHNIGAPPAQGGGGGAAASAGGSVGGGTMTNFAQSNPQMVKQQANYDARLAKLQGREGQKDPNLTWLSDKYKSRFGEDNSQQALDFATGNIRDQAAGTMNSLAGFQAATGREGGYDARGIEGAAQRAQAGAATQIGLAQQQRLDNLTTQGLGIMGAQGQQDLTREGALNNFTLAGTSVAESPVRLAMAQQALGLQQQGQQDSNAIAQAQLQAQQYQQQMSAWLAMMRAAGYQV